MLWRAVRPQLQHPDPALQKKAYKVVASLAESHPSWARHSLAELKAATQVYLELDTAADEASGVLQAKLHRLLGGTIPRRQISRSKFLSAFAGAARGKKRANDGSETQLKLSEERQRRGRPRGASSGCLGL